jgi:hypothetical protein
VDWARAIERNSEALKAIVATLFSMLGLTETAKLGRIPRDLHRAALRILRPAESALRRLIVIAARGLVVKLPPSRPMPKGVAIARKGGGRMAFQLFDTRQRLRLWWSSIRIPKRKLPRSWIPDDKPAGMVSYRPEDFGKPEPPPKDGKVDASRLGRRLLAIKQALENLPAQAKRLARWRLRRQAMASPKFTSPLRPGRPPGHRKEPKEDVDLVLKECHALARDVEIEDTS